MSILIYMNSLTNSNTPTYLTPSLSSLHTTSSVLRVFITQYLQMPIFCQGSILDIILFFLNIDDFMVTLEKFILLGNVDGTILYPNFA